MSTVSVSNIKNASSAVNNAVTTSGGDLTNAAGVSFMGGSKNLLYNGAMQVAQRGTSTTGITAGGYYSADRWVLSVASIGTWTQDIQTDAPTGSGLRRSFRALCTTADAAPASSDQLYVAQVLEGQDVQRIAKGTASAQQLTLSFWVKSNVTGTYVVSLYDNDNNRQACASYTISASATWEKKTITLPADTTGVFDNDNAASLYLLFMLGAGSDFTSGTLQTTWATYSAANRAVGQVNLAAATNNYWMLSGVQLEVGPVATSFEFKSFGQELRECQRYYYLHCSGSGKVISGGHYDGSTQVVGFFSLPVQMRTDPTLVTTSGTNYYRMTTAASTHDDFNDVVVAPYPNRNAVLWYQNTNVSGTSGVAGYAVTNNASSSIAASAEL